MSTYKDSNTTLSSTINLKSIAESFVNYFNNRIFSKDEENQLFNDTTNDTWWMSGSTLQFPFVGNKSIKDRIESQFPVVKGFDYWSFKCIDTVLDKDNNKIIVEIDCNGIGYGGRVYSNNYLFILSINASGKIYQIREYLDASLVKDFGSNFVTQQFNKLK